MIISTFYSCTVPLWPDSATWKQPLRGTPRLPTQLDDKALSDLQQTDTADIALYVTILKAVQAGATNGQLLGYKFQPPSPHPQRCCCLRSANFTFCVLLADRITYQHQF